MAETVIGQRAFAEAVREQLLQAMAADVRELWLCDPDFAHWPLNDATLVEALSAWAGAQRRVLMLAQHYDDIVRCHPRFARWHRGWSFIVDGRVPAELEAASHPTLLVGGRASLRLLDRAHWHARLSHEPPDAQRCRELFEALSQRSSPGFAATTLGL